MPDSLRIKDEAIRGFFQSPSSYFAVALTGYYGIASYFIVPTWVQLNLADWLFLAFTVLTITIFSSFLIYAIPLVLMLVMQIFKDTKKELSSTESEDLTPKIKLPLKERVVTVLHNAITASPMIIFLVLLLLVMGSAYSSAEGYLLFAILVISINLFAYAFMFRQNDPKTKGTFAVVLTILSSVLVITNPRISLSTVSTQRAKIAEFVADIYFDGKQAKALNTFCGIHKELNCNLRSDEPGSMWIESQFVIFSTPANTYLQWPPTKGYELVGSEVELKAIFEACNRSPLATNRGEVKSFGPPTETESYEAKQLLLKEYKPTVRILKLSENGTQLSFCEKIEKPWWKVN